MVALSPRNPEKPHSDSPTPRRTQSPYQKLAKARGYTVKLSPATEKRLRRGIKQRNFVEDFQEDSSTADRD